MYSMIFTGSIDHDRITATQFTWISISKLFVKVFSIRTVIWLCLKHTTTVEHSLISTGGRDGLGMRLHRQVATTIADLR